MFPKTTLSLGLPLLVIIGCGETSTPGVCPATCDTPPASECLDNQTRRIYLSGGECQQSACVYPSREETCGSGCEGGRCLGGSRPDGGVLSCEGLVCKEPPAARCIDAQTLQTHDPAGVCDQGRCIYTAQQLSCPEGCVEDLCAGDPCLGKSCTAPPASTCADTQTLMRYEPSGSCAQGQCQYTSSKITCPQGCADGACTGDPCAGVSCDSPPASYCADAITLRTYAVIGACAGGHCTYGKQDQTCPHGCAAGACTGDPCLGKSCSQPPADTCVDADTLRTFPAEGSCSGGSCTYPPQETTCPFGCVAGACTGDPCLGKTCDQPPATYCKDSATLRVFPAEGSCSGGSCTYSPQDSTCVHGCVVGACAADPCEGVTCSSPPADLCVSGALRSYAPAGQCSGGGCTYSYVDQPCDGGCSAGHCVGVSCGGLTCDQPPASVCDSSVTLHIPFPLGSCEEDACVYAHQEVDCSEGCFDAQCLAGSWRRTLVPVSDDRDSLLAVDSAGDPHIFVAEYDGVHYVHRTLEGWSDQIVDPLWCVSEFAVAVAPQGRPAVAYYDYANKDLRYAVRSAAGFDKELVLHTGDVGRAPSLAFGPDGQPRIAFYDDTQMAVSLATRAVGGGWSVEILADHASLGFNLNSLHPACSLSFDASGKAHLAVGHRYSLAKPSGSFFQPPALYFESTPSGWTKSELTDEGIINQRSLHITSQGEVLIAYGALGAIGQQDKVMLHQVGGGADEQVMAVANLIGKPNPMALLTHGGGTQVVMRNLLVRQQDSPGSWSTITWPLAENALLDATRGADGRTHLLIDKGYIGVYWLTPAP